MWRGTNVITVLLLPLLLAACTEPPWNNPYPTGEREGRVFYSSFEERPKFLDPARSYSSNEWAFLSQVYEPPLQYHFLKRPYVLEPLTATQLPELILYDEQGAVLPPDADPARVAYSDYIVRIRPAIRYQPHPAFSQRADGSPRYWPLDAAAMEQVHTLADFSEQGTRELTAQDYIYQIKRLAFSRNHSPIAGVMAEHIRGFADFADNTAKAYAELQQQSGERSPWLDLRQFDMEGVVRLDDYSYRIRIDKVYPQFIYWLAMNFFAPMPWEAERFYSQPGMAERNITLHWYPVGTGPFMLTENNPNLRMVLERNPNFHGEAYPVDGMPGDREAGLLDDAGQPMPFIDKAIYSLEKEAIPRWNKFLQGYYDSSGIGSDSFDQAVRFGDAGDAQLTDDMRAKGIALSTAVEASIFYTGFNMLDPVVGGDSERARLLRRAIAIALDMEEYISIFNNGRGETAQGPLPPGIFGYQSGAEGINPYVFELHNGRPQRRAIGQALELLAQAGYPEGRDPETGGPLVLYYDTAATGPESKAMLDWYRKQFKKLGIQLVIRSSDYNRFQEKMLKGTAQIYSWGWHADYPDPENFLFLLHGPNGKVQQHGENASNYSNPEFDALFERMKNLPNGDERMAVIGQMVEILRRDGPWIWGVFPKAFSLHHDWYRNAKPHLIANNTLKYKRIDPQRREQLREQWNEPVLWPLLIGGLLLIVSVVPAVISFKRRERRVAR